MAEDLHLFDQEYFQRRGVNSRVLEHVVLLAIEIAREGREGRRIGTLFVVDDSEAVLRHSKPLILDPLAGHSDEHKHIEDPNVRETIKELAQLDGAFIISGDGVVLSACRYLDVSAEGIHLPFGLGSRHMAAASITAHTRAVAVVVSESSMVRIFDDGKLITELYPELWLFRRFSSQLAHQPNELPSQQLIVLSREDNAES